MRGCAICMVKDLSCGKHEADSHKAVRGSGPGALHRIRSVVVGSDCYHSEVGSSIPGYGK